MAAEGDSGGADGLLPWRTLLAETAGRVGDRQHARWLCEVASGCEPGELVSMLDEPATERAVAHLDAMVARRLTGEPIQYVLGRWGFRRLDLMVDRRVLIPRPETELLVGVALDIAEPSMGTLVVADLGTGSGAVGLAIADELPAARHVRADEMTVYLTDVSAEALEVARANLAGIGRNAARVRLGLGRWYEALPAELVGRLDLVVSNPPYIADGDDRVDESVLAYEPRAALFAGADGLDHVREIVAGGASWLRPGGALVLEIGAGQAADVGDMLARHGYADVIVHRDLAGHDRVVQAKRAAS